MYPRRRFSSLDNAGSRTWLCRTLPLLAAFCYGLSAQVALADDSANLLEDRFVTSLGIFILESETSIRLDGESADRGTSFDWEDGFSSSNGTRFRWDGAWRFADRHRVRGLWFNFSRSRTETFDEEIDWGDVTFPVGAEIAGTLEFDIYELAYEYSFLQRDNLELSGSIGLHLAKFGAGMKADVNAGGGSGTVEIGDEGELNAPLPVIGGHALWRISGDFWFEALAQFFALEYDNVDGRLIDTRIGLLWQPSDWVGIGIGFNRFDIDVDVERSRMHGSLEWVYDGPQIYYNVSF
jgi:hypothetical protein